MFSIVTQDFKDTYGVDHKISLMAHGLAELMRERGLNYLSITICGPNTITLDTEKEKPTPPPPTHSTNFQTMKTYQIIADLYAGNDNKTYRREEIIINLPANLPLTTYKVRVMFACLFEVPIVRKPHWAELHEPPLAVPQDQPDNGKLVCAALGGLNRCTEEQPSPTIHW